MTDDLTAFVAARLNEDEARANAMQHDAEPPSDMFYWCPAALPGPLGDLPFGEENCDCGLATRQGRALREVAAMRAILDEHSPPERSETLACMVCHAGGWDWEPEKWPCPTARHLAAIWSDHPDYRQEWAPAPATI